MADVYICYHEASAGKTAAEVAADLENEGISCWYARRDIRVGSDFIRSVPPQIDSCKIFLLFLNEQACQSHHIEAEVGLAFKRAYKSKECIILPCRLDDCKLSDWMRYYLTPIQMIDMRSKYARGYLVKRIIEILEREFDAIPKSVPTPESKKSKPTFMEAMRRVPKRG